LINGEEDGTKKNEGEILLRQGYGGRWMAGGREGVKGRMGEWEKVRKYIIYDLRQAI